MITLACFKNLIAIDMQKKGWLNFTNSPSLFSALSLFADLHMIGIITTDDGIMTEFEKAKDDMYLTAMVFMEPVMTIRTEMNILKGLIV